MKQLPILIIVLALACSSPKEEVASLKYPTTTKTDSVDTYFDTKVADPYRWLENDTAKATGDWVKSQNDVTFAYLNAIPFRDQIKKRLEEVYNYERVTAPFKEGDYYYFYKNNGLQNQSVLFRKKGLDGEPEVFLDPNGFSKDGTSALGGVSFTKDGTMAAYLIQEGGSDWRKAVVIKTVDKAMIGDTLRDLKFTGISWRGNEGFYYSSYDKPKGSELSAKTQYHKIYYHKLNSQQKSDVMIFGGEKTPRRYAGAGLTEDERFLIISAYKPPSAAKLMSSKKMPHMVDETGAIILSAWTESFL